MSTAPNHALEAHYRAELKAISRASSAGERRRSIIAAAAYGSRSMLPDHRQDREWAYTRKRDLRHSEIIAPANAPAWAMDRAQLWNRVDAAEKRKDANTGRELILSLPRQLDRAAHVAALRDFAAREFLSRGLAVDINVHAGKALDGGENEHAHLLTHTRPFDCDGFASKKLPWLTNPTAAAREMEALRASWADCLNRQLELASQNVRVSHLSRAARADLAESVMVDTARPLSDRAAAARRLDDLSAPPEPKIGHRRFAKARREVRSIRRREGRRVELADQLAATSPDADRVIHLRAVRAVRRAETAKALNWTAADDARLEKSKAPTAPKARKPRKTRPSEVRRAETKLAADRAWLDGLGQRLDVAKIAIDANKVAADRARQEAAVVRMADEKRRAEEAEARRLAQRLAAERAQLVNDRARLSAVVDGLENAVVARSEAARRALDEASNRAARKLDHARVWAKKFDRPTSDYLAFVARAEAAQGLIGEAQETMRLAREEAARETRITIAPATTKLSKQPAATPAPPMARPHPVAERRAAEALAARLRLDRAAEAAGWRRLNELGARLEHGDGRTLVLAPSIAAVAGYDAAVKSGMRALVASDEARAKEPTLLRALFSRELDAAKTAGRKVVALIERTGQAFAAWAREVAPHAELLSPPGDAPSWESLAPPPEPETFDHEPDESWDEDTGPGGP